MLLLLNMLLAVNAGVCRAVLVSWNWKIVKADLKLSCGNASHLKVTKDFVVLCVMIAR